jgi:hypothetical protein
MRKQGTHPDPQKREEPDPALQLSEAPAPIDAQSFGRKLAEIIAKAVKASSKRGRRRK